MGDSLKIELKCPLCCNKTFDTKISLIQHLADILSNLTCPICDNKWSSLAHLIEHLNFDDCRPEYIIETLEEDNDDSVSNSISQTNNNCDNGKFIRFLILLAPNCYNVSLLTAG